MNKNLTVPAALVFSVALALAQTQSPPQSPPTEQQCADPAKSWQPLFQFPESAQQAQSGDLWKVDFQELVNKGRLNADQANFLAKESAKAKESQGKLVSGYVIAYNPCSKQVLVDYQEGQPPSTLDQNEIVKAALNVAAADTAQQQAATAPPAPGKSPSAGTQIGQSAMGAAGFANPLAFALVPAAGYVGGGIQKGISKIASSGKSEEKPQKPQAAFNLNKRNWWRDF